MEKTKLELFKEIVGNKISDIKQLFEIPAPVATVEFVDVKTSDGAVLRVDGKAPVVGGKCMIVDATGANPAPDAEYALEDGSTITVVGGVISEVESSAAESTEPTDAAKAPAKMDEELAKVATDIKSVTIKYAEMEKKFSDSEASNKVAFEKIAKENETLKAQNIAMLGVIEQLADLPIEEPAQAPKNTIGKSRFADLRESVKEIKAERKKLRD